MRNDIEEKVVFDKADLMERLDDDIDLAAELTTLFISDVRQKIASLRIAISQGSGSEIEHEAHSLKGAASNLSAEKVCYLAGIIEAAGKNNNLNDAVAVSEMLFPAIEELIMALKAQIIEMPA